jgi:hypothetical protein
MKRNRFIAENSPNLVMLGHVEKKRAPNFFSSPAKIFSRSDAAHILSTLFFAEK